MFDFSVSSDDYFTLDSFSLGCTRCGGSNCVAGYFPANCTITVSGVEAPEFAVNTVDVSYVAPAIGTTKLPYAMQKVNVGTGGLNVHFSLREGGGQTFVYIDDLVYTLQ